MITARTGSSSSEKDQSCTVEELRKQLRKFRWKQQSVQKEVVSTGLQSLDQILPDQGLVRGTLSEWIAATDAGGALSVVMRVAGQVQQCGPLIIVDRRQTLYPPAMTSFGVSLSGTIVVHPNSRADELWVAEQALRCPGVGAVLCRLDRLRTQEFRRLQLAVEAGSAIGLLVRPAIAVRQPSWADVRLLVAPERMMPHKLHRRLRVQCLSAKGSIVGQSAEVSGLIPESGVCDEANTVRLASGVSGPEAAA